MLTDTLTIAQIIVQQKYLFPLRLSGQTMGHSSMVELVLTNLYITNGFQDAYVMAGSLQTV